MSKLISITNTTAKKLDMLKEKLTVEDSDRPTSYDKAIRFCMRRAKLWKDNSIEKLEVD